MKNIENELNHGVISLLVMTFFVIIGLVYFYKKKPNYYKVGLTFLSFLLLMNIEGYFDYCILYYDYMYVEGKVIGITRGSRNSIKGIKYEYLYNSKILEGHCYFPHYIDEKDLYLDHKYFSVRHDKQIKACFAWLNLSQYFVIFFYQCAALQEKNASS